VADSFQYEKRHGELRGHGEEIKRTDLSDGDLQVQAVNQLKKRPPNGGQPIDVLPMLRSSESSLAEQPPHCKK
jgi:hypothetical protein